MTEYYYILIQIIPNGDYKDEQIHRNTWDCFQCRVSLSTVGTNLTDPSGLEGSLIGYWSIKLDLSSNLLS